MENRLDNFLTASEAAAYVGLTEATLASARSRGGGPAFYKGLGRKVLYRRDDLDQFIASRRIDTVDARGAAAKAFNRTCAEAERST